VGPYIEGGVTPLDEMFGPEKLGPDMDGGIKEGGATEPGVK
jgi:hypothetical protein